MSTNGSEALSEWPAGHRVREIVDELIRLDEASMAMAFRLLDRDRAMEVFEALAPHYQQHLLEGLRDDRVGSLIEA